MHSRERLVLGISSALFVASASLILFLVQSQRDADPLLAVTLTVAYALISRVRFEFGNGYVVPEQLVFVAMLLLLPLEYVPLLVACAGLAAAAPDALRRETHPDRWWSCLADSWFSIGPVLVLAALAPGHPKLDLAEIYALAFAAQIGADLAWSALRNHLVDGMNVRETLETWAAVVRFDAILTPIAFLVTLAADDQPLVLLALGPLVWLFQNFSRDRQERYAAALELHRAYRGTVMLLSDVIEFDDPYTAAHSRSIVDLVNAVSDEMGIHKDARRELEFAALLHDVGKIAIPKEILNKPAALTDQEFELMKTHTVEGQFILDRVGGLLGRVGEIVRSCHERWDGGGYPDGLTGKEIPFASRIVFVCDAYNAMTTDRPYRQALPTEEAIAELSSNAGTQFDSAVVDALIHVVKQGEPTLPPVDEVRAVLAGASRLPSQLSASG